MITLFAYLRKLMFCVVCCHGLAYNSKRNILYKWLALELRDGGSDYLGKGSKGIILVRLPVKQIDNIFAENNLCCVFISFIFGLSQNMSPKLHNRSQNGIAIKLVGLENEIVLF
ncbi:hypothetical protein ACJX0J_030566, partial [Zea mays]